MIDKQADNRSDTSSAVIRAVDILDALCESAEPLGISTLAKILDMPKVTTFRILNSLVAAGLLFKNADDLYSLSPKFLIYGNRVHASLSLKNISEPILTELAVAVEENVNLGIAYKNYVLTLFNIPAASYLLVANLLPLSELYCSSMGKTILSHMDEASAEEYFSHTLEKRTPNTVIDYRSFQLAKEQYLQCGIMYDDEEFEYGLSCFAAPIYDANDNLIAAVSVSGPKSRILSKKEDIESRLLDATHKISAILKTADYTVEELKKTLA